MLFKVFHRVSSLAGAVHRRTGLAFATALHRASLGAVGQGSRFQMGVCFRPAHAVAFGADCYVWRGVDAATELPGGHLRAGCRVQINKDVHFRLTIC